MPLCVFHRICRSTSWTVVKSHRLSFKYRMSVFATRTALYVLCNTVVNQRYFSDFPFFLVFLFVTWLLSGFLAAEHNE